MSMRVQWLGHRLALLSLIALLGLVASCVADHGASEAVGVAAGRLTVMPLAGKFMEMAGAYDDAFGKAVAVSGNTAVVGANGWNSTTGAVYVFVRNGGPFMYQARVTATESVANDNFGYAVAINGN